jgi:DNA transformation protein
MAVSDDFRDFVLEQLALAGSVTPRAMFGGVGLYLDGLFFRADRRRHAVLQGG